MKKTLLFVLFLGLALNFTACKGEKKEDKAKEPVKMEEPAKAKEVAAPEVSPEEKAFLAVVDKIDPANKCTVCHHATNAGVGPNYTEVAKVYKEKGGNIVQFLKGNAKAIVLPERFNEMQVNLEVTKKLSGDDLNAIATYIRSLN